MILVWLKLISPFFIPGTAIFASLSTISASKETNKASQRFSSSSKLTILFTPFTSSSPLMMRTAWSYVILGKAPKLDSNTETSLPMVVNSPLHFSKTRFNTCCKKPSMQSMFWKISWNAISGSIIQNSDKCLRVFDFSALNVGPNV